MDGWGADEMIDQIQAGVWEFDPWFNERMTQWENRGPLLKLWHRLIGETFWTWKT